jgi:hypothetical protein
MLELERVCAKKVSKIPKFVHKQNPIIQFFGDNKGIKELSFFS